MGQCNLKGRQQCDKECEHRQASSVIKPNAPTNPTTRTFFAHGKIIIKKMLEIRMMI